MINRRVKSLREELVLESGCRMEEFSTSFTVSFDDEHLHGVWQTCKDLVSLAYEVGDCGIELRLSLL